MPEIWPGRVDDDEPQPNPDTPPDERDPAGVCPRCGRNSNFECMGSLPVTSSGAFTYDGAGGRQPDQVERVSSWQCLGCGQATAVVEEAWIGDHPKREGIKGGGTVTWRGVHWWPPPGVADMDEAIPQGLRDGYAEAVRALGARAPRGAAVLLRRVIEGVVTVSGSEAAKQKVEANLAKGLGQMAEDGDLDRSLAEWAKEVRLTGNAGAHYELVDDVTQEEADDLAKLARQILHYVYEMPAKLRRARSR